MKPTGYASTSIGGHRWLCCVPACVSLLLSVMLIGPVPQGLADEAAASSPDGTSPDPLATKEQIVRDRMTQLEDRMFRLTEKLADAEPEQAERLENALRRARELLVRRNMDETIRLIEAGNLTEAADRELIIVKNLEEVLAILLEDPDNTKQRQKEIDQLQEFRDKVESLLEEERELKAKADAVPRLQQLQQALRGAIARIEGLIAREQKEIDKTSAAVRANDNTAAGRLGQSQKQTRLETESLAEDLNKAVGPPAPTGESDEPGDHGHDEESTKATGDKNQSAEAKLETDIRKAEGEVKAAAGQMKTAENELGRSDVPEAVPQQKKARESLQRALKQLQSQQKNIDKQLDQADAARKQRELEKRADKLANEMQSKPGDSESKGDRKPGNGQQGGGQQGSGQQGGNKQSGNQSQKEPAPGAQNVQQAGKHMNDAAQDLEKNEPADAAKDEEKAIDELEKALDELQQALDQLRQEQQEEILRSLETRFRAMLARQLTINTGTETLDDKGKDLWTHADHLALAELAQDEKGLVKEAGEALHVLEEEGTTIVFPQIVEQMQEDMQEVADRLGESDTGADTQRVEADIVTTLEELIEAVKQLQDNPGGGGGGGGGGGSPPPLLPNSAELKLLRSCQQRVNKQTVACHAAWVEESKRTPRLEAKLDRVGERQRQLAEMARKMNERVTGQ